MLTGSKKEALQQLQDYLQLKEEFLLQERQLVLDAKELGASWEEIGKIYGVSRQAVWERFGRV